MSRKEEKEKKYLIEYEVYRSNNKEIGKDDVFHGEGVFYIKAKNELEAKRRSKIKIRKSFKRLNINLTRVEEAVI